MCEHTKLELWWCISPPGLPEKVALYFVSGICAGLVFLLCLFGIRSTLVRDIKGLVSDLNDEIKASRRKRKELMDDLIDDEVSDTSSFCRLTQSYRTTDVFNPSALAVELAELEVQQTRHDLPNGDIWPHLDSSPYAIHKIKSYNNWGHIFCFKTWNDNRNPTHMRLVFHFSLSSGAAVLVKYKKL